MPKLAPESLNEAAAAVPKTMPRSIGHYEEWVAACKGGPRTVSNWDYAGPLTETVLLGNLAVWCAPDGGEGKKVEWDAKGMACKNAPEAAHLVKAEYHNGYKLT
jgi:hypothetical protein